jgi:hypothetical protein
MGIIRLKDWLHLATNQHAYNMEQVDDGGKKTLEYHQHLNL